MSGFGNINKSINTISLQKREGQKVVKKKAGRPRKPHMKVFQIRLNKVLFAHLKNFCENEHQGISSTIAHAVKQYLNILSYLLSISIAVSTCVSLQHPDLRPHKSPVDTGGFSPNPI